jgi:hypothetical protein
LIIFPEFLPNTWRFQISKAVFDGRGSGVDLGASEMVERMPKVLMDDN